MTIATHAYQRMKQREFSRNDIGCALRWGTPLQGSRSRCLFVLTRSDIEWSNGAVPDSLENLLVVTDKRARVVITMYRARDAQVEQLLQLPRLNINIV